MARLEQLRPRLKRGPSARVFITATIRQRARERGFAGIQKRPNALLIPVPLSAFFLVGQ